MATAERFTLSGIYGAAGPNDGIEASAIQGTIPEANLPSTSVGVSGTSFLKEASPSSDIVLTTPVSSNTGAWEPVDYDRRIRPNNSISGRYYNCFI